MTYSNEALYILRIILASVCGYIIGLEREMRLKEAGVRTHCLVACGAALMMIISKYAFFDMQSGLMGVKSADPARIAAQVVTGVGFIGSGIIFVNRNSITGLTTAAGIWTTAGVAMAIAGGMYLTGVAITVFIVITQVVLHKSILIKNTHSLKVLEINNVDNENYQDMITSKLKEKGIEINSISIKKKQGLKNYHMIIDVPNNITEEEILSQVEYDSEIKLNEKL